jgi:dephospho-CoA kinase
VFAGKPIIGIVGGIGSGKSTVAQMFGDLGCLVIDSDQQIAQLYRDQGVQKQLQNWWGADAIGPDGRPDRSAIARIIFDDPSQRLRLQNLLFPKVARMRRDRMQSAASDPQVRAFVWDTPLLIEAGLVGDCDAVVFVHSEEADRLARLGRARSWKPQELSRREKLQAPLDKKRQISDYVIENTADAGFARGQVRLVLSRILERNLPDEA